ncbi:putative tape measure protein [Erwinia phage Kuerle]|nr:putative tape measure protein [Erwinia phage Kuerle]
MENPAAETQPDISKMSDDEILAMDSFPSAPADAAAPSSGSQEEQTQQEEVVQPQQTDVEEEESTVEQQQSTEEVDQNTGKDPVKDAKVADNKVDNTDPTAATSGKETQTNTEQTQTQKDNKPADGEIDYKAFHETILKPFKANGKMVAPKDAAEAIQLMQMGANYTRKMQDLAPYRKAGLMLENVGLLDETKLSYLIDLHNKDPQAIKKLIEDSGYDVHEHDPDVKSTYTPNGNHTVSDDQVAFKAVLDDVASSEGGRETLHEINTKWDQASKDLLFTNPEIAATIHSQRESGVYQKITAEIEHMRTLGQIGASVPFLQAYRAVGDKLQAAGAFNPVPQQEAEKPAPVAVRAAKPKPQVDNSAQAAAAASTRTGGKPTKPQPNFAVSDEEFMKQFENR